MHFNFDNTYARKLEGFYTACKSSNVSDPKLVKLNVALAAELGLDASGLCQEDAAEIFSGNKALDGASTLAQVYAGHQFGGFSHQLGDGRALLLGEVVNNNGARFDIQLKGSGRTPYSRGGDGKAALGPVLREYIISEAMNALSVPTTRSLAAVTTGEIVVRDEPLPGAVLTRVAASHIRVGTFEYFAARGETSNVRKLADYTLARHFSGLKESENPYLALLVAVCDAQAALLAKWILIGFIHGVMNTDNMTISGETIDYGPCAFMDYYEPETVFSSIDLHGRYAYQNQPQIAQWNLARFAETLLPLIDENKEHAVELALNAVNQFPGQYTEYWLAGMRAKVGLTSSDENDLGLMNDLLASMVGQHVDYTQLFRSLTNVLKGEQQKAQILFDHAHEFNRWTEQWLNRLSHDPLSMDERIRIMNQVNPIYIPRNHKVEEAIEYATRFTDYSKFEELVDLLTNPYQQQKGREEYAEPATKELSASYKTFCGT